MTATNVALPKLQHVAITFPPGEAGRLRDFYINVLGFEQKPFPTARDAGGRPGDRHRAASR